MDKKSQDPKEKILAELADFAPVPDTRQLPLLSARELGYVLENKKIEAHPLSFPELFAKVRTLGSE